MSRIILTKKNREYFFSQLIKKNNGNVADLAGHYNVSARTIRDWKRGKFNPSFETVKSMAEDFEITLPNFEVVSDYWYIAPTSAKKAAMKRVLLHGSPGTPEGRSKGGRISQENRRRDPEKYRNLGCNVAKKFLPLKKSADLAELFGIILGDGCIRKEQIKITLNRIIDKEYSFFVSNLIRSQLGEMPSVIERNNVIEIHLYGTELVKRLEENGLKQGNKTLLQVKIPEWIIENDMYARRCLRGLFDTDGGLYIHRRKEKEKNSLGWCFTNYSAPIIRDVKKILLCNGINPRGKEKRVYLYAIPEIRKFMEKIGSSNPKNINKYNYHMNHFYNYEWKKFAKKEK